MTTIQKQLDYYTSNEYLRNKKTQSFLLQIMEGLQSIPKLEIFLTKENKEIPKVSQSYPAPSSSSSSSSCLTIFIRLFVSSRKLKIKKN
jgi:hypothetical protein